LYARPLVALTLTLLVALAPTLLENNFGRMDWGVIGSLSAVLYFNICMAQGDHRRSILIGLGVAAGMLVTMKLNGPAFGIFVASALVAILVRPGAGTGRMLLLVVPFMLTVSFLSLRQIYYFQQFVPNLIAQIDHLKEWSVALPKPSLLYYVWDILRSQGTMYRALIWGSVPVVIVVLSVRTSLTSVFVFGGFSVFLILSLIVGMGYSRGGYHLLPLFVMMIAIAFAALEGVLRHVIRHGRLGSLLALFIAAALLAEPMLVLARNYTVRAALMYDRPYGVSVTRTLPAKWMAATFRPGTRVATILSNVTSLIPPIHKLRFVYDNTLITRPGDIEPYRNFDPPSLNGLRSTADVFLLTDWQQNWLHWRLVTLGQRETADRWKRWLEIMRHEVPSVIFSSSSPGYYYRSVEIFVLDPAWSAAALRASLATVQSPVEVRGP